MPANPFPSVPGEAQPGDIMPGQPGSGSVVTSVTGSFSLALNALAFNQTVGVAQPGAPYLIGSATVFGTSLSIPVGANVNSGDSIQVGVTTSGASSVPTVGPDSQGNNYANILSSVTESGATLWVFESDGSGPLTAGIDTIPVTQTVSGILGAIAVGDDGVIGLDKAVIAAGSSPSPSSGSTGSLTQIEEHAIAWIVDAEAGGAPSWASPWSSNVLDTIDVQSTSKMSVAYQEVTSTNALTASATITSAQWAAACTTLIVPPIQLVTTPSNGIVGVPYSQTIEATGGDPPLTWVISSGYLPAGLALTGATIFGTPLVAGVFNITIKATDSLGVTASFPCTIVIAAQGVGNSFATPLSNNLLSAADADFEVAGYSWSAQSNATAPQRTQATQVTGDWALYWASLNDGPTSIATAQYPVTGQESYLFSCGVMTLAPRVCQVAITWLDVNGLTIRTDAGPTVSTPASGWAPLYGAFTSPANAVWAVPGVIVQTSQVGDTTFIDTAFFTNGDAQVLIDWTTGAFVEGGSAGSAFMDVSPWVRIDADSGGIAYSRGRQNAISEIQPGSATFKLQNDQGQWAQASTVTLPAIMGGSASLQVRAQINFADETGTWWTRFDGSIAEIDYEFDNTGYTSTADVTLTDVLSSLNRQDVLYCWTKEAVMLNGPLYHWTLDDSGTFGGSKVAAAGILGAPGIAAETSGNNGPAMRVVSSDPTTPGTASAATITWQDTSGGVETLADAASATGNDGAFYWTANSNQPNSQLRGLISGNVGPFTTPVESIVLQPATLFSGAGESWPVGTQTTQNTFVGTLGYMLEAELPNPLAPTSAGSNYAIEMWFVPDPSIASNLNAKYGPFVTVGLGASTTKVNMLAGIFLNTSGPASFEVANYNQPPSFLGLNWPSLASAPTALASTSTSWTADTVKRPHHLVLNIQGGSPATVFAWLDGSLIGSFNLVKGQTFDTITIGGAYGGCGAWIGNLSMVSIYPFQLSPQQITLDCQFGQYGMWESTTDDCIEMLSEFANIPSFWSNLSALHVGLSMADYYDISQANAIANMQIYEQTENGLLFVNAQGQLTFLSRGWRMGHGQPDLLLPDNVFDAALQYQLLDQFMCNEEGVSGPNTLGATATSLQAGTAGATQLNTTTSTVIQVGYINQTSQDLYGVYAPNPVGSPLSLPLITWSRGYAALGLPSFSFWVDPNLIDRASWDAISRATPWFLPGTLTIDLLTFEEPQGAPSGQPKGISSFYALDIGNVVAPTSGSLPASMPNQEISVEWFIEGVSETYMVNERQIEFYTSPAEPQRAWIPGDPTYGVLGQTAKLGISMADINAPQADGKDVSHDAGGPYWPPTFSTTMNVPAGGTGAQPGPFVGASDMRGIALNLQSALQPPMCVVSATTETQSFTNGALSGTTPPNVASMYWDVVHADTAAGMGAVPGWPNWYLVTQAGFYEIDANVTWSVTGSGLNGYTGQAWIIVAKAAAQALAAGTGNPLTVDQYVCPVGEGVYFNSNSVTPICAATTRMYLGVGDMVCVGAEQNYTSSRGTSTAGAGSAMALRFAGLGRMDDRTLINTALSNGGSVSLVSHGTLQQATFNNTFTYSFWGTNTTNGYIANGRRNTNLGIYQGLQSSVPAGGSQCGEIAFNASSMSSTLTGHTVLSATLTGYNISAYYQTGAKLMLGTTRDIPGGSTFNPGGSWSTTDVMHQRFATTGTLTFSIPVSLVQAFVTGGAQALVVGDAQTTDLEYSGEWQGGADSWSLVVNYV